MIPARSGTCPSTSRYAQAMSADFSEPVDLIERATRKAGLIWIKVPGDPRAYPAWHHWHDGSAYVLNGGGRVVAADRGAVARRHHRDEHRASQLPRQRRPAKAVGARERPDPIDA